MCVCDRESEEGEKKEKREVIRFKNSFFSVFLHGCHVPAVEVLCVSRLCYLLHGASQRREGAMVVCKLLLISDLSHFATGVYVTPYSISKMTLG